MARMPVLAGGLLIWGLALTAGCQSTSAKKPNQTPTPPYMSKNNQPGGGSQNLANADAGKFPVMPAPAPTPRVQPVSGSNFNTNSASVNDLGGNQGVTPALVLPASANRTTTTTTTSPQWPDPNPQMPSLGSPSFPVTPPPPPPPIR